MTTKDNIISELRNHKPEFKRLGIVNVGLFGSFLRNEQTENSDIDILVEFDPTHENFDNYMAAYDIIENLFKNHRIEVVTKNGLSPYIGPRILHEVVYA